MKTEHAELALGSRIKGNREKGAMRFFTLLSTFVVSLLLVLRFLRFFIDMQTGYWVFSLKTVKTLYPRLKAKGFEIEMELFVLTFKKGLKCIEVPVIYRKRLGKTKFHLFSGFRNLSYMIYYLFCSFF